MLKVGLTGGIGTGKSTVAQMFSLLGVPIYEADRRAKFLLNNDLLLKTQVQKLLGEEAYKDEVYNSKWIAKQVFQNTTLLEKLNTIVHPAVGKDWVQFCLANQSSFYVIKEAAIMRKEGLDYIINVLSPLEVRIERVLLRDAHRNRQDILNVISKQNDDEYFKDMADFNIHNGSKDLLIPQVLSIHKKLLSFEHQS